ncbi:helix-turn-helix domain-containing protein [Clostridioides difficile]|uniref:helix-turn-helix domain-containing protein n=1 Tax=Clostridioides difficile TaxID=1496 RepID=UPI00097FD8EE|nr:helix-turn-helix transcriptional regulator [Clostridioides difficile]SJR16957.1 Uncharacterised protein [Clostridioides difficile]SJS45827.1 Uncharacterised protein [Clostridioides difficile]SJT61623.1 Uncharacterised protein [Clostridioides difficile]HBF2507410.1 helix-turn-helix domain-containing protein [Clostridioides difficile]HBF5933378.1 helix-turn-helix domain-containing protein [Clostridioides difficile]
MNKKCLPKWSKEVKKAMIDRDLKLDDLSEELGLSKYHLSAVINDRLKSPNAKEAICKYLEVKG